MFNYIQLITKDITLISTFWISQLSSFQRQWIPGYILFTDS